MANPMIPIMRPWIGEEEAEAARRVILSGWITQGPEVAAFEKEFAAAVGAPYACATSNCTTALHLALLAAGVGPGDEVVTVSHSFIATANSIRYCGGIPVFVDIQPNATYNMDPSKIERVLTSRTKAILCVHQIGMPCDIRNVLKIARAAALPVIEDCACAIGSEFNVNGVWERVGRPHGDMACFSLHPRKVVSTGDGGMITTARGDWDEKFRLRRQHGMSVPDTVRHNSREIIFENYPELGYNFRMTDIQAAVGRVQLGRLPEIIRRRRELAARYKELLKSIPEIVLPLEPEWARSNWQSFCVRLPDTCDQRNVMRSMLDASVSTRRGIMCAHREPAYAREPWSCGAAVGTCDHSSGTCPNLVESEKAQDHTIVLPLFHEMTDEEQQVVATALASALRDRS